MSEQGKRLLRVLAAAKTACSAKDTGMTQAELARAVADLGTMVDDDNRPVAIVRTTKQGNDFAQLELTPTGRHLAAHA